MGTTHKAPFKADAGDTEQSNIIHVKKKMSKYGTTAIKSEGAEP